MATIDELVIELKVQNDELKAGMKESQKQFKKSTDGMQNETKKWGKTIGAQTSKSSLAFASFAGGLAANLATGVITKFASAVGNLLGTVIGGGIANAAFAETAFIKLSTAFNLAGQDGKAATAEFAKFAGELQQITTSGDEATLALASVIQSVAKLGQEDLQRATVAALDMSAALGIDAKSAATILSKALSGQTSALSRYGVIVETTGDQATDTAAALTALEETFGGTAQAVAKSYGGRIKQLDNAFNDWTESVGLSVTQNQTLLAAIGGTTDKMFDLIDITDGNSAAMAEFIAEGVIVAIDTLGVFVLMLDLARRGGSLLIEALFAGAEAAAAFQQALIGNFSEAGKLIDSATERVKGFGKILNEETVLGGLAGALAEISVKTKDAFAKEKAEGFKTTLEGISGATKKAGEELTAASKAATDFTEALTKKADDPFNDITARTEFLKEQKAQQLITEEEFLAAKNELLIEQIEIENALLEEARIAKGGGEEQFRAEQLELERQQSAAIMKLKTEEVKQQIALDKQREANIKSSLGTIATLQSSSSSTLQGIGKAAAIAQATMDGIVAVQKAWAVGGPILGPALAGLVGVATAANVAKIAGVGLQTGIDSVPGVGVTDNFPAILAPGERVVPRQTNQDLSEFLAEKRNEGEPQIINNNIFNLHGILPSDGEQIIEVINDATATGAIGILSR